MSAKWEPGQLTDARHDAVPGGYDWHAHHLAINPARTQPTPRRAP
jgi:hypothetical protein